MPTTSSERCEDFAADARKVLSQRCAPDERHCSCVPHLRAEVERLTAAQLADEVATIARLEQEIGRLQSALGGEIAARQAADVAVEEAQLTLAAEQGRAEGAPSEGWTYGIIDDEGGRGWRKPWPNGMIFAWGVGCYVSSSAVVTPHPGGWSRWRHDDDGELDEEVEHHTDEAWSTRAAMLAADAADAADNPK